MESRAISLSKSNVHMHNIQHTGMHTHTYIVVNNVFWLLQIEIVKM